MNSTSTSVNSASVSSTSFDTDSVSSTSFDTDSGTTSSADGLTANPNATNTIELVTAEISNRRDTNAYATTNAATIAISSGSTRPPRPHTARHPTRPSTAR